MMHRLLVEHPTKASNLLLIFVLLKVSFLSTLETIGVRDNLQRLSK